MNRKKSTTLFSNSLSLLGGAIAVGSFFLPWAVNTITYSDTDSVRVPLSGKDFAFGRVFQFSEELLPGFGLNFEVNLFNQFGIPTSPWLIILILAALIAVGIAIFSILNSKNSAQRLAPISVASGVICLGVIVIMGWLIYELRSSPFCSITSNIGLFLNIFSSPVETCSFGVGFFTEILGGVLIILGGVMSWVSSPDRILDVPPTENINNRSQLREPTSNNVGPGRNISAVIPPKPPTRALSSGVEQIGYAQENAPEVGVLTANANLYCEAGEYRGRTLNILGTRYTIGRRRENHLILSEAQVSKDHAVIRFAQGKYFIQDMSRGGTFVNEQRINASSIKTGDQIRIGSNIFVFRY